MERANDIGLLADTIVVEKLSIDWVAACGKLVNDLQSVCWVHSSPLQQNSEPTIARLCMSARLETQSMPAEAYIFDAYGTLFDVHSAAARHSAEIGERWQVLSDIWRTKQLEYTWVRSLAGQRATFWQVTQEALDFAIAASGGLDAALRDKLLSAYRELDAYPEVPGVLGALRAQGAKVAILSNGDPAMLADAVRSAGVGDLFDAVLSVEPAGIFKPAPRVYELATSRFGLPPRNMSFLSSNRWDIAGAKAYGFCTVWINRGGRPDEYPDLAADTVLDDLRGLIA